MADAELQTFTSIMDALVRISVSVFASVPHFLLFVFACGCEFLDMNALHGSGQLCNEAKKCGVFISPDS